MKHIAVFIPHPQVLAWRFSPRQAELLETLLPGNTVTLCRTRADFEKVLPDVQVALVWYFKEEWFARAAKLEWLVTPAAGRELLRVKHPPGLAVHNCRFHGRIMAQTVVGMILARCRGIIKAYQLQTEKQWPLAELEPLLTTLRGARVTILGFGAIGGMIARLVKPFGARITGVKRSIIPLPDYLDNGDRIISVDTLDAELPQTDHLVMALPGDTGTDNIMDTRRLGLLPPHAAIYNVGRGNALDEGALVSALRQGRVSAAFLDVFQEEPLSAASPLRTCPNCCLMPHVSALAPEYLDLFVQEVAEEFKKRYGE
ncbi:MAG: NAD(P)-dependent oxidoreductase [Spirochaetia bacterium]